MLADFDQSKTLINGIVTSQFAGTKEYYSPQLELASVRQLPWNEINCAKTDVFALGLVFLQIINSLDIEQ